MCTLADSTSGNRAIFVRVSGDDRAHATTGGRQRHFHLEEVFARRRLFDGEVIDETKVDDVDGNLRIETGLERGPDGLLAEFGGRGRRLLGLGSVAADGPGVGDRDLE